MRAGVTGIVVLGAGSALELYARSLAATGRQIYVCDLDEARAAAASRDYGFLRIDPDLSALPSGSVVLNLTPPGLHGQTSAGLLELGHPVYSEKPAAHDAAQLDRIHQLMMRGARFAVAPDTHLGPAVARAAQIAHAGELGPVRVIRGRNRTAGPETWHPRPWIFFSTGGGVCLDIASYFLRAVEAIAGDVTIRAVRTTVRARPDLMPPGVTAVPVPARAQATVVTRSGIPGELDLSSGPGPGGSRLRISFTGHELVLDPVESGSPLTLARRGSGNATELVPPGPDQRGAGLLRFLAGDPDRWFGPGNAADIDREQRMLLALDRGET